MKSQELIETARTMVAGDIGLLAMAESNPTCNKRFAKLGILQTEETRRAWRELIVTKAGTKLLCRDTLKNPYLLEDVSAGIPAWPL
jgi:fructose-bisphosphate aldolase class 1